MSYARFMFILLLLFIFQPLTTHAQTDPACPDIVTKALQAAGEACSSLDRNTICYGNTLVLAELEVAAAAFETPGDQVTLETMHSLQTHPFDAAEGYWGIALMQVQADLPDTLPGQNVTFLLLGDTRVVTDDQAADTEPMQAFYFSTGMGVPSCDVAPDSLVIQSPAGYTVTLKINGAIVDLGSTSVLSTEAGVLMDIMIVEGQGKVTANGATQTIAAGQMSTIALDNAGALSAVSVPSTPVDLPTERITGIAFDLLPAQPFKSFEVGGCTVEDTRLKAGDLVRIQQGVGRWPTPEEAEAAFEGLEGTFVLDDERLAGLRTGIFVHGPDQHGPQGYGDRLYNFWIATPGTHVIDVTTSMGHEVPPCRFTVEESEAGARTGCTITATGNINQRRAPSIGADVDGVLEAGASAAAVAQTIGPDGFAWWRTAGGLWVREDVVNEIGPCDAVLTVAYE